jgi:hypothetical protein
MYLNIIRSLSFSFFLLLPPVPSNSSTIANMFSIYCIYTNVYFLDLSSTYGRKYTIFVFLNLAYFAYDDLQFHLANDIILLFVAE